ncbi:MAG TPA: oxidoreductase [Cyanobacteria bacterium UBA8156]|jgi:3-hydroxyisobutyrate dehydrogenase|nr:oxidoreductase [Cyanobacteria bacterium UBA8156]
MAAIAFLGLGVMGSAMAANLVKQGFAVQGWNRTPARPTVAIARAAGVTIAPDVTQAVTGAAAVFTCLGNGEDVATVVQRALPAIASGIPIVDCSTIGPTVAQQIAAQLAPSGHVFIDAPMSGGDVGARNGTLTFMVGGNPTAIALVEPYLRAMGQAVHVCGPVGAGQAVKLCNQVLAALNTLAVAEALALATKLHLDPHQVVAVCSGGAAGSWSLQNLGPRMVNRDFAPGFSVDNLVKDLQLVQAAAEGLALPGLALVTQTYQNLQADGKGALGTQAVGDNLEGVG